MTGTYNIFEGNKNHLVLEDEYHIIRSNIEFLSKDELKSITIISSNIGEGKTTISMNLGISFAKNEKKVLIIDADFRKALLNHNSNKLKCLGLTDLLCKKLPLWEALYATDINNLYYLPSGLLTPNPTEFIASKNFAIFLSWIKRIFDVVLIDTSALAEGIDAALIASKTDGTILVFQANKTQIKDAEKLKNQLEIASAKIIGAILNQVMEKKRRIF